MHSPLLTVVTPTFNEEVNVRPFLTALRAALGRACDYEVLFVDDSTDSTPEIVRAEGALDPRVRLLHRPLAERNGLAGAYADGFREARGRYICCIDADLQHPPEKILDLLRAAESSDADVAVASRYTRGGSGTAGLDNIYRKAVSLGSKYLAQCLFKTLRLSDDPGGGFYLFRRDIIAGVELRPLGYKMLMEIMVRGTLRRVVDVPYTLRARERGTSKATIRQGIEFLRHCARLYTSTPGIGWLRCRALLDTAFPFALLGLLFLVPFYGVIILTGSALAGLSVAVACVISLQGIFHASMLLDAWKDTERARERRSPQNLLPPKLSFTALIPARHEAAVIGETIRAVANFNYPHTAAEALVLCQSADVETIRAAERAIGALERGVNVRLVVFDELPTSKPHALNIGLREAHGDVVAVFDAEDEPHRDLYRVVNTVMECQGADVVQSGVQLMNHTSRWFSAFCVLEYFFWFKSALHVFARTGFVPLGGNTVFFRREVLQGVGGWDPMCLTEDADIGVRLSARGARISVLYDEEHVTREEAPPTLASFIRQRTRWNLGFLQIVRKGDWRELRTLRQRLMAMYVLLWALAQASMFFYTPFAIWTFAAAKLPVAIALAANVPLAVTLVHLLIYSVGLREFTRRYELPHPWWFTLRLIFCFYPFQVALGIGAFRAAYRLVRGELSWEKTPHTNVHRTPAAEIPAEVASVPYRGTMEYT